MIAQKLVGIGLLTLVLLGCAGAAPQSPDVGKAAANAAGNAGCIGYLVDSQCWKSEKVYLASKVPGVDLIAQCRAKNGGAAYMEPSGCFASRTEALKAPCDANGQLVWNGVACVAKPSAQQVDCQASGQAFINGQCWESRQSFVDAQLRAACQPPMQILSNGACFQSGGAK